MQVLLCCGVVEYTGLRDLDDDEVWWDETLQKYVPAPLKKWTPEMVLEEMWLWLKHDHDWRRAFVVFTDHKDCQRGTELAKYIRSHKLGTIIQTARVKNPNTDQFIKMWVWQFNKKFKNLGDQKKWKLPRGGMSALPMSEHYY